MKFLIITHVFHKQDQGKIAAYGPFVKEMNVWLKFVDQARVVAPFIKQTHSPIDLSYNHPDLNFAEVPAFNFTSTKQILHSIWKVPYCLLIIFKNCLWADHIHLRCPGNMGLLGCLVQVLFPNKIKTAKYAGNWDPQSPQPVSYRLQRALLSSEIWSRNMTTLVYGEWPQQSSGIKSFFTASYWKSDMSEVPPRSTDTDTVGLIFAGSLSAGKRPIMACEVARILTAQGKKVQLDLYGDGAQKQLLKDYIEKENLTDIISLRGNQSKESLIEAYQKAHFLVLLSKSEGWPKVVAEAMFWGCVPIVTGVSCIGYMLNGGARGTMVEASAEKAADAINHYLLHPDLYQNHREEAVKWSRLYTMDKFEEEIAKLLRQNHHRNKHM